jgi:predicted PolB exonuclease-like 3'-5' exonuclease
MPYLIFDIETIPDTTVWTPPKVEAEPEATADTPMAAPASAQAGAAVVPITKPKRQRKPRATKAKAPEDVFAPLYAHRPIAIGFVLLSDALAIQHMGCVGTSQYQNDERRMLTDWNTFVGQNMPTLVTWAGRRFDLPVLSLRAFNLGVDQRWYNKEYRHRYGESHLDLLDSLSDYGAHGFTSFTLDTFCTILGLPAKGEVKGANVLTMFNAEQIPKIEALCLMDAVRTTFVLLRYLVMRGRIDLDAYRAAAGALLGQCTAMQLHGITFGCDTKRLLLE